MSVFVNENPNLYDALTGERISLGVEVLSTDIPASKRVRTSQATKVIGRDTIVWLAEQAGLRIVDGDAGNSGNSEVVDAADVGVGDGEASVGEASAGGNKSSKRRSSRTTKS